MIFKYFQNVAFDFEKVGNFDGNNKYFSVQWVPPTCVQQKLKERIIVI